MNFPKNIATVHYTTLYNIVMCTTLTVRDLCLMDIDEYYSYWLQFGLGSKVIEGIDEGLFAI